MESIKLYEEALNIKTLYKIGTISREEAKERIKPYADRFNKKSVEIAKKYGQKPQLFSFASFMR